MSTIVALLGAESTGKSVLTETLAQRLNCGWVAEYLREWCEREARTPRMHEQQHIADEQQRRIEAAAARHALVIADTTPLMTAVYSEIVFGDRSLYAPALAWQQQHVALTLVTGLDMPWLPDGLQRDGPHVRMPVDRALRGGRRGHRLWHRVRRRRGAGAGGAARHAASAGPPRPGRCRERRRPALAPALPGMPGPGMRAPLAPGRGLIDDAAGLSVSGACPGP